MKVTKIVVSDFRGFPGPAAYDFDFDKAKNLFIYGENGSGKSSLFRAIQEFFNRRRDARPFIDFKNNRDPALTSGRITVHFDDGSFQSWAHGSNRSLNKPPVSQTALQVGCLDYRSLLETNFAQRTENVNIFFIAVGHLVPHLEVPVDGQSKQIGELWNSVYKPDNHRKDNLDSCRWNVSRFNTGFEPVIKPLIEKATELLDVFRDPDFVLGASFQPVEYDETKRDFKNRELILSVRRNGSHIPNHHNFFNEARLSAIGLVIYLAGLLISVPPASEYPKLLVLDDVLVGLDMANRLPVLEILAKYFSDWQIILLTHDRVWYEMVQVEMEGQPDWKAYELWLGPDGHTPIHRPRDAGPDFFLVRANKHLADNDDRAAALYARAAFEAKVKNYCEKRAVPVPFKRDPKKIDADTFWKAACGHALAKAPTPADKKALEAMFKAIDTAKKVVLNPLSHSTPQAVTKPEIESAIAAVANLKFPSM